MVDSSHDPAGQAPGTPRWVKALAIGAVAVILLVVVVMVIVGGEHGPFRHTPTGAAGQASPSTQSASADLNRRRVAADLAILGVEVAQRHEAGMRGRTAVG